MQDTFSVFFSNRLENLYQNLKQQLFKEKNDPFRRRLVIVYGPAMKNWLMLQMAQDPDLSISMGIEIIYLKEAFDKLSGLFQAGKESYIPSHLELSLGIEHQIKTLFQQFNEIDANNQQFWRPLFQYLKLDPNKAGQSFSRKSERRLIGLSQSLASCFQDYGRYGSSLLNDWKKKKKLSWQQELWKKLYFETGWMTPSQTYQKPIRQITPCDIHFFSISFINREEFQFLTSISKVVPVYYYLFSPCAFFWSDIKSDKERIKIEDYLKKKLGSHSLALQQLDQFLQERNALLANFGRMGREMACQIEESEAQTYASYHLFDQDSSIDQEDIFSQSLKSDLTLLQAIQRDMLFMRNPEVEEKINLAQNDNSIQLHIAPNKRREVEILYHNLLKLIDQKNPHLRPLDIIVMTPEIADYVPHIKSVFGRKESQLDFQILDLGYEAQGELIHAFLHFLGISNGRWDALSFFQLIGYRSFQRRHKLTPSDCEQIKRWIETAGIRWGASASHRDEILHRDHCRHGMVEETEIGTWEYGINRVLKGLTTILEDNYSFESEILPCPAEFSQADILEKWIFLFHSLRSDFGKLSYQSMTLEEWSKLLSQMVERYFQPDFDDPLSVDEFEQLKQKFEQFRISSKSFKEAQFSSLSILTHLESILQQTSVSYKDNQVQTIRFCSMIPLRSIPAKVIAMLGMQEGTFPRPQVHNSLNLLLNSENREFYPTTTDYDRYLFLETVHSSQETLMISFNTSGQPEGAKELRPSLVVEELFSYLDKNYTIQGKTVSVCCQHKHPIDSFDLAYFKTGSSLSNFSMQDYILAEKTSKKAYQAPHSFVTEFNYKYIPLQEILPNKSRINLKSLREAARHPIKLHLRQTWGIYLNSEDDHSVKEEENLVLTPLDKFIFKQAIFTNSLDDVFRRAEKEGKLPIGLFKSVAKNKFSKEVEELFEQLEKHEITKQNIFHVEFSHTCSKPKQVDDGGWILPATTLKFSDDYQLIIDGKIPHVTSQGLLILGKGNAVEAWKTWPEFLMLQHAIQLYDLPIEKQIIFSQQSKSKEAFNDKPEEDLKKFIQYYAICLKTFSPLHPDWMMPILEADPKKLIGKMEQLYSTYVYIGYSNQELKWILNKEILPNPEHLINEWRAHAHELLEGIINNWYEVQE